MRREVTVDRTLLKHYFDTLNPLLVNNEAHKIKAEIDANYLLMNGDLEVYYEIYFEENYPNLLESYQLWFADQSQYANQIKMVANNLTSPIIDSIIPNTEENDYWRLLFTICHHRQDKISFLYGKSTWENQLTQVGILCLDWASIINQTLNNRYNDYRLPINRKVINEGDNSQDLSDWLAPFLKTEDEFIIIDPYFYQNRESFKTYFLPHVANQAKLKIYTVETTRGRSSNRVNQQELIAEFGSTTYQNWQVEVWLIPNRAQHDRNILTNQYCISIGMGMGVFGEQNACKQTDINIVYKSKITNKSLPVATKIL